MSSHRHATDRKDFSVLAECPNNEPEDEHLTLEAQATNTDCDPEDLFPMKVCPGCGADLDIIIMEEPTEVLD